MSEQRWPLSVATQGDYSMSKPTREAIDWKECREWLDDKVEYIRYNPAGDNDTGIPYGLYSLAIRLHNSNRSVPIGKPGERLVPEHWKQACEYVHKATGASPPWIPNTVRVVDLSVEGCCDAAERLGGIVKVQHLADPETWFGYYWHSRLDLWWCATVSGRNTACQAAQDALRRLAQDLGKLRSDGTIELEGGLTDE